MGYGKKEVYQTSIDSLVEMEKRLKMLVDPLIASASEEAWHGKSNFDHVYELEKYLRKLIKTLEKTIYLSNLVKG